ncbi:MAG TPA: response regulator [Longimicrobiales bacterium]|nr:response regulator [Longimicrobiales bacterium]
MARILIADDEEAERALVRAELEAAGHELLYASNGSVALRIFDSSPIDLVITDLAMPSLNGLRLIAQIRERDYRVPIVAVSGVSPEQLERAEELGATVTLRKPYAPRRLLAAVEQALAAGPPPIRDVWS